MTAPANVLQADAAYPRRRVVSGLEMATLAVASGGALAAVALLDSDDGPVLCPFRRCTGGYCPGCGSSRAASRLLRGDLVGSWAHQPFVALFVLQASLLVVFLMVAGNGAKQVMQRWGQAFVLGNTALLLGIWLIRMLSGTVEVPHTLQLPF